MRIAYTTGALIIYNHKLHIAVHNILSMFVSHIFLYSELTLHMTPTNYPLKLIMTFFSSIIFAYKYAPGTSNMATPRFSIALITSVVISDSVETVGDDMVYPSFIN